MGRTKQPINFRQGLTITFGLGVVAAVIATTIASVVLTHILLTRQFRAQALAEAALAARESLYPFLGAPPSEARRVVSNMLGWPYVTFVALDDASTGRRLAEAGRWPGVLGAAVNDPQGGSAAPRLAVETADYCLVVVPLLSAPAVAPFGESQTSAAAQRLGELQMIFSKSALHQLTLQVGVFCSCAGALIAFLSGIALRALQGRRIDEYTESLERTVEARTREWRRASEAAQQAERAKSALLQASAHELKMPLHLIELQVAKVLHELEFVGSRAEPARRALATIVRAANELLSRIVKMLDAARSAGASYAIVKESFNVRDFADALRERAEALASSQGDELVVECSGAAVVYADREKLFEVTSELCLNACKFTNNGMVRLRLEVSDRSFLIDVTDTGRGIPESEQDLIWLEFQQGSGASPTYPGQGLGLSMVRQLVDALHGTVALTSAPGAGTRVRVTIPIDAPGELIEVG